MTEEVGLLQRVATRLSLRKVKKEEVKEEKVDVKEVEKEVKEKSDVVKNGTQESGLHNDTKVGGKEPANELSTDGGKVTEKGKKKKAKGAKKKDDNGKESVDVKNKAEKEEEEGVMQRLKSRLSMRGKKKEKVTSEQQKECNGTNEDAEKEEKAEKKEIEEEPVVEEKKWVSGSKEKEAKKVEQEGEVSKESEKEEKKKSDNAFLRMLRKLSFRKKKEKKGNTENESGVEEGDKGEKELEKTLADGNNGNDGNNGVEKRFEERETRPQSLVMSSGRPPPGPGRPPIHPRTTTTPSSATANVSRPVSDLDSALRQFKLSTAESRESLRTLGSRQDLTQVEERVREAVGKNLSRQGSLRRGASGSTSIPITLSVSLQELRANQ